MKKTRLYPWLPLAGVFALIWAAGCDGTIISVSGGYNMNRRGETAETEDTGDIESSITKIRIDNRFGNVDVKTVEGDATPNWNWKGKVWADDQETADLLITELVMDVQTVGNSQIWTVKLPEKNSDINGIESNLELIVSANTKIDLENRHGNASIQNVMEEIDAENSFGDLELTNVGSAKIDVSHGDGFVDQATGSVVAKGSHGALKIKNVEGQVTINGSHSKVNADEITGDVDIETSFGKIIANGIHGNATLKNGHNDITADVDGNVNVENRHGDSKITCSGKTAKLDSSHGDILLTMTESAFTKIEAKTSFDDIEINLPSDSNPNVQMKTTFGDSNSQFGKGSGSGQKVILNNSHGDIDVQKVGG